ncbi:hypothetical protein DI005_29500 [Prauserella sp. PE36]|uniref:Immunity protein Imm1 n=1 Tax=Prauserella endophytica TaxID=1592324 RepID=A0ABY2SAG7_9PSEU|nr:MULTISPECIES: Imm1 family immunity protein [Prauserella]RBM14810.1 hypothetical protein DI005_29500 [Prauserella sp. PE36]TKG72663.1 hypothetical protein FCN18_05330 [Prauserella endophytica]
MKVTETAEAIKTLRDHAADPTAARHKLLVLERADWTTEDDVWGTQSGPNLHVYAGPNVGFLIWEGRDDTFITTGGTNIAPVEYAVDEWKTRAFPERIELPVAELAEAMTRFAREGERPANVGWKPHDPSGR